jgi:hypothetical protein
MPAVNKPIASVFCGARTAVKVRTVEWMSCGGSEHRTINIGVYPTYPNARLHFCEGVVYRW